MASNGMVKTPEWPLGSFRKQHQPVWFIASFITGLLGIGLLSTWIKRRVSTASKIRPQNAASTDPGLLKKCTTYESYTTPSGHVYPHIRTFYSPHPRAKKLPDDLPLLVFMHGLGGSVAQFVPLLTSLVNTAPCLAIDLPGCGLSEFEPHETTAYTTIAFAELLFCAVDRFRNKETDQEVVLVGHSMGCSISALLASSHSPLAHLCSRAVLGMVAICPRSTTLTTHDLASIQRLSYLPSSLFDLLRSFDRRGGIDSASVLRVVGKDADEETKKLQLRFNQQSQSSVFQRVLLGLRLQETQTHTKGEESLLGRRVWNGIKMPLFLVAAENDRLAPPKEVEQIAGWLTQDLNTAASAPEQHLSQTSSAAKEEHPVWKETVITGPGRSRPLEDLPPAVPAVAGDADLASKQWTNPTRTQPTEMNTESGTVIQENHTSTKHAFALKISVFPAPSSHGLLYATADVRVLSGLIENFFAKYVDKRLSPAWQLQHLTTSGKWDVKNLKKWQSIDPCSAPIAGVFRAMKTMREVDHIHSPAEFLKRFSWKVTPTGVAIVVDISHESPVYDKNGLEHGGVEYHKFPTVSKLPPTADEVEHFISLIDEIRRSPKLQVASDSDAQPTIGIHCHYGFNRTGFFVICYLVERLGYRLQDAVEEFASKRAPGVKHEYFVNELFVRYAVKMERRGTVVQ